jgi:putative SOS response-associated peptidase YedK
MCGRFVLSSSPKVIAEIFHALNVPELLPKRYNIAPTQDIASVRQGASGRELAWLRWGLIAPWAKDAKIAPINAQAETAATKPFFRHAMKKRRCLVPADGYYEWKATGGKAKQPYLFAPADGKPFAFAGLWEAAELKGEQVESCAVLTTNANELAAPVHSRMPVILPAQAYDAWLDPANQDAGSLQELLRPYPAGRMRCYPVSTWVNNPRHDDLRCVQGVDV